MGFDSILSNLNPAPNPLTEPESLQIPLLNLSRYLVLKSAQFLFYYLCSVQYQNRLELFRVTKDKI